MWGSKLNFGSNGLTSIVYMALLLYCLTSALNVASSPLFHPPIMWYGNLCYKALLTLQHYWFFYLDSMDIEFLGMEKHLLTFYIIVYSHQIIDGYTLERKSQWPQKETIGQNKSSQFTQKSNVESKGSLIKYSSSSSSFMYLTHGGVNISNKKHPHPNAGQYKYIKQRYPHPNGQYVMPSNYRLA